MAQNYEKIGKSRYKVPLPKDENLMVFKDKYTGLWRAQTEGGPVDYFDPCMTLREMKERIERLFEE